MADEADVANAVAEMFLANAIKAQQSKLNQATIHHVECQYCGDFTENGHPYCCKECRDDHSALLNAQARNNGRGE